MKPALTRTPGIKGRSQASEIFFSGRVEPADAVDVFLKAEKKGFNSEYGRAMWASYGAVTVYFQSRCRNRVTYPRYT
jgi:hypothetical protein